MSKRHRQRVAALGGLVAVAGTILWLGTLAMQGNRGVGDGSREAAAPSDQPEVRTLPRSAVPEALSGESETRVPAGSVAGSTVRLPPEDRQLVAMRREMVEAQIRARGVKDERVLDAMLRVPRHRFVGESLRDSAYADSPQRIGYGQTISQPYIVALMTELARPTREAKALDVGTGSGYQAAVLSELCRQVYSIEIIQALADEAQGRLAELGYANVTVRCGDGYRGWPEQAPFDLIIVAAAPDHIPQPLIDQLAERGRLVIPVGSYFQNLVVVERGPGGAIDQWTVTPVAFVPMTGEAQRQRER